MSRICKDPGYPTKGAVTHWVMDDKDDCSIHYARARETQALHLADELLDIADDGSNDTYEKSVGAEGETVKLTNFDVVQRSRLRVDTRKWVLSKMLPKIYGEKLDLTHKGKVDSDVTLKVSGIDLLLESAKINEERGRARLDDAEESGS